MSSAMHGRPGEVPGDTSVNDGDSCPHSAARLARIWSRALKSDAIDYDDNFFDLGGGSLQAMEIAAAVEHELGVKLPLSTFIECPTISSMDRSIQAEKESGSSPLLIRFQPGDDSLAPLFLVHGLLGQIFLPPDSLSGVDRRRPVYGIRARGLAAEDAPARSVAGVVNDYIDAIDDVVKGRPFHLGGFCHGTLIAVEMAAALRRRRGAAVTPILIDPPVRPRAEKIRGRPFGRIRLAALRLRNPHAGRADIERRLRRHRSKVPWPGAAPDDSALQARVTRVAVNMRHLLRHHIVTRWEHPAILLTSRERGRQIARPDSFWRSRSGDNVSIRIVAETHRDIFSATLRNVFVEVNDVLESLDPAMEASGMAQGAAAHA